MAHVSSGIKFGEPIKETELHEKTTSFRKAEATEKELIEIYERTYGPIKRNEHHTMKTPQTPSYDKKKLNIRRVPSGPEYVLVDGYNIIFGWDDLKAIARDNLDLARHTLINMLSNYQ